MQGWVRIVGITIECFEANKFPLNLGWARKINQKFGKKGVGKRISPEIRLLLEGIF